jgi:hypothetical protein
MNPDMVRLERLSVTFRWNLWAANGEECLQSHEVFLAIAEAEILRVGQLWLGDGAKSQVEDKVLLTSANMREQVEQR